MINIVDLISEIRNGFSQSIKGVSGVNSLSYIIDTINGSLVELNKEGFVGFNDVIDVELTEDKEYYLGNIVSKVNSFYKYNTDTDKWDLMEFDTDLNDSGAIFKRSEQHIWFNSPVAGQLYRFYVSTHITTINKDFFIDIATFFRKKPEEGEDEVFNVILDTPLVKHLYSKDTSKYTLLELNTSLKTDITYFYQDTIFNLFAMLETLFTDSIINKNYSKVYKLKDVKYIGLNETFSLDWVYSLEFFGNDDFFNSVATKRGAIYDNGYFIYKTNNDIGFSFYFEEITDKTYSADYSWSDVLNKSVSYLQTQYQNSINGSIDDKITEYSILLSFGSNYNKITQQRRYEFLTLKDLEVEVNLGAIRSFIDLPIVFKEVIILFIAYKLGSSFNLDKNTFRTDIFSLYKEELSNLRKLGYLEYVRPISEEEEFRSKGFI
jgi:hypothetical protein